jgi:hypothetical protein
MFLEAQLKRSASMETCNSPAWRKPSLEELGTDLLVVGRVELVLSLALPFLCAAGFYLTAARGWWPAAVRSPILHTFNT